jgi:hypothetical protein
MCTHIYNHPLSKRFKPILKLVPFSNSYGIEIRGSSPHHKEEAIPSFNNHVTPKVALSRGFRKPSRRSESQANEASTRHF